MRRYEEHLFYWWQSAGLANKSFSSMEWACNMPLLADFLRESNHISANMHLDSHLAELTWISAFAKTPEWDYFAPLYLELAEVVETNDIKAMSNLKIRSESLLSSDRSIRMETHMLIPAVVAGASGRLCTNRPLPQLIILQNFSPVGTGPGGYRLMTGYYRHQNPHLINKAAVLLERLRCFWCPDTQVTCGKSF